MITSSILRQSGIFREVMNDGETTESDLGKTVYKSLNLVAKLFITSAFGMASYVPAEIYPTNYR